MQETFDRTQAPRPRDVPLQGETAHWRRVLLLALLLLAFARLTWDLDGKGLWWDESLSLQRAEQPLGPLLLGHLVMFDGIDRQLTIDQHPFFFFLLQGILLRLGGDSEYTLRFVSVMAATLLVPAVWVLGRWLAARAIVPPATPLFGAVMAAISPYYLWFGQEARPYALWGFLSLLSVYLLAKVTLQQPAATRSTLLGYVAVTAAALATHFYAVFLLPLHALAWFIRLYGRNRRAAIGVAAGLLLAGGAIIGVAYVRILVMQGGGGNFSSIRLGMLAADLLNAFSMGLSVDLAQVWPLDLLYGMIALLGVGWILARPARFRRGGWLILLMLLIPVGMILLINLVMSAYMTARHMSLIGGAYFVLLGVGLAVLWRSVRWGALLVVALLVMGAGYSTVNYFTIETYAKEDMAGVASYLAPRLADGDLILLQPPFSWRIFEYYLPLDRVSHAIAQGAQMRASGVPRLGKEWAAREAELAQLAGQYRRIWLVTLGTYASADPEQRTEAWLDENLFQVQSTPFFGQARLTVALYLPQVPVGWEEPRIQHPEAVVFGEQIRLAGYAASTLPYDGVGLPVTLYWQTLSDTERRYKYALRLVEIEGTGDEHHVSHTLALTEREPYDGAIPTIYWAPGQTIAEMTELSPADWDRLRQEPARHRLALEVYDAETLEKLPVTAVDGRNVQTDDATAFLPYWPQPAAAR